MRVRTVRVSSLFAIMPFVGGYHYDYTVVENGLPKDAIVRAVRMTEAVGMIEFLVESQSFEEVRDGDIPFQHPLNIIGIRGRLTPMKVNIVVNPGTENESINVFDTKEAALEFLNGLEDTSDEGKDEEAA